MKKFLSLLLLFALLSPVKATNRLFEVLGRFEGLTSPQYPRLLEEATALYQSGMLANSRFMLAVGTEDEFLEVSTKEGLVPVGSRKDKARDTPAYHMLNKAGLGNIIGFREAPDFPVDAVAFLLQRLFPSQDGINLVPNQLTTKDPVSKFSVQTIGVIINHIRNFYHQPLVPDEEERFIQDLAFAIDCSINPGAAPKNYKENDRRALDAIAKRHGQKPHKPIADFARTVVLALRAADNKPQYSPYFVHKALLAFALRKAEAADKPQEELEGLFEAMGDVAVEGWRGQVNTKAPFDNASFKAVFNRVKENPTSELTEREKLLLMCDVSTLNRTKI